MRQKSLRLEEIEMFNKILVAIDNSTRSRKVFEAGMFLAKTTGASLMLLQVKSSEEKNYPSPFKYYLIIRVSENKKRYLAQNS